MLTKCSSDTNLFLASVSNARFLLAGPSNAVFPLTLVELIVLRGGCATVNGTDPVPFNTVTDVERATEGDDEPDWESVTWLPEAVRHVAVLSPGLPLTEFSAAAEGTLVEDRIECPG